MRPTDDELEATAAKFDVMRASYEAVGVSGEYGAEAMEDAAAMLRACKTGDALEHTDWNAAIEAAANVALDQEGVCSKWFMQTGYHCNIYEQLPIVADLIRALKKGSPQ